MKIFEDLDKMIDFQGKYKLGNRIVLYHTTESIKEFQKGLNQLGRGGVSETYTFPAMPESPVELESINYRGFEILVVNVDNL